MVARQENPLAPAVLQRPGGWLPRFLAWATAAYVVGLVFSTHYPRPQDFLGLGPDLPSDKTMHIAAYGILSLLASATLAAWGRWTPRQVIGLVAALAVFGMVDEITQPLFTRMAELHDWFADCKGIALGVLTVAVGKRGQEWGAQRIRQVGKRAATGGREKSGDPF